MSRLIIEIPPITEQDIRLEHEIVLEGELVTKALRDQYLSKNKK